MMPLLTKYGSANSEVVGPGRDYGIFLRGFLLNVTARFKSSRELIDVFLNATEDAVE
jgi:hypothetical protein